MGTRLFPFFGRDRGIGPRTLVHASALSNVASLFVEGGTACSLQPTVIARHRPENFSACICSPKRCEPLRGRRHCLFATAHSHCSGASSHTQGSCCLVSGGGAI